jgi:hypothetical protein
MYLRNRPVYYTNGVDTIAVNYSAHARDLEQTGWTRVEVKEIKAESKPEPKPEPVSEAVPSDTDLTSLTKSELVSYAEAIGAEVKPGSTKADIIAAIEANG